MEAGTLHQIQMKKKKMRKRLCYVGLVVLIILLLTPPAFRLFISDDAGEKKEEKSYISLICNKEGESISSTFENGVAQNIMYKIKGNVNDTLNNPDALDDTLHEDTVDSSNNVNNQETNQISKDYPFKESDSLLSIFSRFVSPTYDENEGVSIIRVSYSSLTLFEGYDEVFKTVNSQENFFTSRGFSCSQSAF